MSHKSQKISWVINHVCLAVLMYFTLYVPVAPTWPLAVCLWSCVGISALG